MKRFNHLYERICRFENLLQAFYQARKGKRSKPNVAAFEANMEWELLRLEEELRDQTYRPGSYRTFKIYDPKERMISAAPFRDRVVHHALCNIIEPILDRTLIKDTYANRKGMGTHAGIRRCQDFLRKYDYVLKADIRKYFPNIDHAILKQLIRRKIKCPHTLWLIDLIIDNSNPQESLMDYFPGDDLFTPVYRSRGLPMGNLTSQFFANVYLSPFDHFVKEELGMKGYVRYVDDMVFFHNDKRHLHKVCNELEAYLKSRLRLMLHPHKTVIFPTRCGAPFLGQRIFRSHRVLAKTNVRRFYKRLDHRIEDFCHQKLSPDLLEMQLNSWLGHAKQADTWLLRRKIYNYLVFRKGVPVFKTVEGNWLVLGTTLLPS